MEFLSCDMAFPIAYIQNNSNIHAAETDNKYSFFLRFFQAYFRLFGRPETGFRRTDGAAAGIRSGRQAAERRQTGNAVEMERHGIEERIPPGGDHGPFFRTGQAGIDGFARQEGTAAD